MAVVFGFFVLWQNYMKSQYPPQQPNGNPTVAEQNKQENNTNTQSNNGNQPTQSETDQNGNNSADQNTAVQEPAIAKEEIKSLKFNNINLDVTNFGLGFPKIEITEYTDREDLPIKLGQQERYIPFASYDEATGKPIVFNITRFDDVSVEGEASLNGAKITKVIKFEPGLYSFTTKIKVEGHDKSFMGIRTYMPDTLQEYESSFIVPSYEHQEFFFLSEGSEEREIVITEEAFSQGYKSVKVASVSSQYFALSLVDSSDVMPTAQAQVIPGGQFLSASLLHKPLEVGRPFEVNYRGYMGPKDYALLEKVDKDLYRIIDFGMFSFLAHPFLGLMKWFFSFLNNWGLAIIALTILVRMAVLPFNVTSYKSMKKMQKLQGPISELRERYKEEPQKLNAEMMALWKREGVNPVSGCLPMLLQLPVFIALYQVLGKSIELYKAPFAFWIHDLSVKDPYYVLPVLMGVTMFVQTKISPSTADPAQKKIFMFMPIVFTLFMVSLPSGLTLYIFVSTLFGIFQQLFFMRDTAPAAKEAEA